MAAHDDAGEDLVAFAVGQIAAHRALVAARLEPPSLAALVEAVEGAKDSTPGRDWREESRNVAEAVQALYEPYVAALQREIADLRAGGEVG